MEALTASKNRGHPTEIAKLRGARMVSASETEEGHAWAESRIKTLTGGDRITGRLMNKDFFDFRPEFKLFITGNNKPRLNDVGPSTRRRFNILPFVHKPAKPNLFLEEHLKTEGPAILQWAIQGCLDWQQNGLVRSRSIKEATDTYFDEQDLTGQWLDDECHVDQANVEMWTTSTELFGSYKMYSEKAGEPAGSVKNFSEKMKRRGFEWRKKRTGRGFLGIAVRHNPKGPDEW
jgi:putative DNA primase/helicase